MTAAIRTDGLVKDYGKVRALDGLDLEVERGEVFGFLGPNGAGKSTTIRLLLDLLRPTAGRIEVLGEDPRAGGPALRARIGYLPGDLGLPRRRTAGEYLRYLARLRGGAGADRIEPLARVFGLDLGRPLHALSKGNRQKVTIIQAFMHRPELLVLDEPTSSLDPLLQQEFRRLVDQARDRGSTVFLSSHVLAEVEEIASRVAIIRAGKVVDVDDVGALRERAGQDVVLRFASPVPAAEFRRVPGCQNVEVHGTTVTCRLHGEPWPLLQAAMKYHLVRWHAQDRDLEQLFLDFYRDGAATPDAPGGGADGGTSDGGASDGGAPAAAARRPLLAPALPAAAVVPSGPPAAVRPTPERVAHDEPAEPEPTEPEAELEPTEPEAEPEPDLGAEREPAPEPDGEPVAEAEPDGEPEPAAQAEPVEEPEVPEPEVSDEPAASDEPEASDEPTATEEPGAPEPEVSDEPEASDEPAASGEPEPSDGPGPDAPADVGPRRPVAAFFVTGHLHPSAVGAGAEPRPSAPGSDGPEVAP